MRFAVERHPGFALETDYTAFVVDTAVARGHELEPNRSSDGGFFVVLHGARESLPIGSDPTWFAIIDVEGTAVPRWRIDGVDAAIRPDRSIEREFIKFLDELDPAFVADGVALDVEAFARLWLALSPSLNLPLDDKRTGDALALMASEAIKSADPPRAILRETVRWFAGKADLFAERFVAAAGTATGTTAGVGLGAAATGQLPHLVQLIAKLSQQFG